MSRGVCAQLIQAMEYETSVSGSVLWKEVLPFAAIDAQLLYAAPSHSECTISGHRQ
jgi:hypothetical protein